MDTISRSYQDPDVRSFDLESILDEAEMQHDRNIEEIYETEVLECETGEYGYARRTGKDNFHMIGGDRDYES